MPVTNFALAARPPQKRQVAPWHVDPLISCTLPQPSHSMRRNHDGKAHRGRANASAGEGRGSVP